MQRAVQFLEKTYTLIQLIAHSNAKMRNNVYLNCSESHMAGFVRWVTAHSYAKAGVFFKEMCI